MRNLKRILCVLLALVMLLGMAACAAKSGTEAKSGDTTKTEEKKTEEKKTEDKKTEDKKTTEPAADPHEKAVSLTITLQDANTSGRDEVNEALKAYVKEKLNVDLDIILIPKSAVDDTLTTVFASGSGWDVSVCTAPVYEANVGRGAFMALDDYIDTYIPSARSFFTDEEWQAFQYDGKTYCLSVYKDLGSWFNLFVNDQMEADLGVTFPREFATWFDLVDTYRAAKAAQVAKYPDKANNHLTDGQYFMSAWFGFDPLIGSNNKTLVCTNIDGVKGFDSVKDTTTVFCPYYTDEFREWVKLRKQLVDEHIILGMKAGDTDPKYADGSLLSYISLGSIQSDPNAYPGFTTSLYLAKGIKYTSYVRQATVVVNPDTKNPERACELIELLYSDKYLANLMHFGIEGADKDWTDVDNDGVVEFGARNADPKNRSYYMWYGIRNYLNVLGDKTAPGTTPEFADVLRKANDTCLIGGSMGMIANLDKITNEVAACTAKVNEFMNQAIYPATVADVDALCDDFIAQLKANGMDTIVAEMQSQLDAYLAAK